MMTEIQYKKVSIGTALPPNDDDEELPNAGVEEEPKAGAEAPKAGEDEAPNAVVEENGEED